MFLFILFFYFIPSFNQWDLGQDVFSCSKNNSKCGNLDKNYFGASSCFKNETSFLWFQGLPSGYKTKFVASTNFNVSNEGIFTMNFYLYINATYSPSRVEKFLLNINDDENVIDIQESYYNYTQYSVNFFSKTQNNFKIELITSGGLLPLQVYFCKPTISVSNSDANSNIYSVMLVLAFLLFFL